MLIPAIILTIMMVPYLVARRLSAVIGYAWGPVVQLIRGSLQLMILYWVYWLTIRRSKL